MPNDSEKPVYRDPDRLRAAIRGGTFRDQTAGQAPGRVQANLVILPSAQATSFLRYCQLNPKPCPVLAVGEIGDHALPALGTDIDVRSDVPGYCVYRNGELSAEVDSLSSLWRDDFVAFALGCSFSFEEALVADGIRLRHLEQRRNVAMYRTNVATAPAGEFRGPLVVSMRPLSPADAIRAIQITSRFPTVHGAPVHLGDPAAIGIADLARPDYGDAVEILPGELPVFWACGVTPQAALKAAKPPFCITHKPGHMLVTDLFNARLAAF